MRLQTMIPRLCAALALSLGVGSNAHAAEIVANQYTNDYSDGPGAFIVVDGETQRGDYERFLEVLPKAIALHGSEKNAIDVWLIGPGGDLDVALKLGNLIYDLGFATLVDKDDECASACALIWLGGAKLYMHPESRVGFHQAYELDNTASIEGNALVGHYLSEVGLSASVVRYVMTASPDRIAWLDTNLLEMIGLPVNLLK